MQHEISWVPTLFLFSFNYQLHHPLRFPRLCWHLMTSCRLSHRSSPLALQNASGTAATLLFFTHRFFKGRAVLAARPWLGGTWGWELGPTKSIKISYSPMFPRSSKSCLRLFSNKICLFCLIRASKNHMRRMAWPPSFQFPPGCHWSHRSWGWWSRLGWRASSGSGWVGGKIKFENAINPYCNNDYDINTCIIICNNICNIITFKIF